MQIDMSVSSNIDNLDTNRHIEGCKKTHNTTEVVKKEQKQPEIREIHKAQEREYTEDELLEAIELANEDFRIYNRRFEHSIHEKTKKLMVKVIDVLTDDIIREIPPEKMLDAVADRWEMAGILVDERI